jgi:hypothetical protein
MKINPRAHRNLIGSDSMALGAALLESMKLKESKLTDEERQANKARFKALQEERRIKACIVSGTCPSCQSKLIRGKKDKKNDYKRKWTCIGCFEEYHM